MKISFLVTYYNQAQFVKQSLESILAIKKPCDWEILIGDDGSTDDTVKTVQKYIEDFPDNIKLYSIPRENGRQFKSILRASANRLNLVAHCKGDFFCFLDGDDWYCDREFIKQGVDAFSENGNVSVVAFNFKETYTDGREKVFHLEQRNSLSIIPASTYLKHSYIHAGACMFRNFNTKQDFYGDRLSVLNAIGFYDDNDIVVNNLLFGDMFYINRTVYSYRQTGDSLWTGIDSLEKHVINAIGYDADVQIAPKFESELLFRNSFSLLSFWIYRKQLFKVLGSEKYENYYSMSSSIPLSLTREIFDYDKLSNKSKKHIRKILLGLAVSRPRQFLLLLKTKLYKDGE